MHKRKEIKAFIKNALLNKTSVAERVHIGRYHAIKEEDCPAICIYSSNEVSTKNDNINQKRETDVLIQCVAYGYDAEEKLDDIAIEVEKKLVQDITLGGSVSDFNYVSTEYNARTEGSEVFVGLTISYKAVYYVEEVTDAPTDIADTANITYPNGEENTVDIPQ